MASRSMISDPWRVEPKTVIEVARREAGLSQRRLAEYRPDPAVVGLGVRVAPEVADVGGGRAAAGCRRRGARGEADGVLRLSEDPEVGSFVVPGPVVVGADPGVLRARQALKYIFHTRRTTGSGTCRIRAERIAFYELVLRSRADDDAPGSVDGVLLIQAWPHMNLPERDPRGVAAGDRRGHGLAGQAACGTRAGSAPGWRARSASLAATTRRRRRR